MELNYIEVSNLLDTYKVKALKEYGEIESKRHTQLGDLFNIKKEIPILGTQKLNGANEEVMQEAMNLYHHLAVGNFKENEKNLKKHGKNILQRATLELRQKYQEIVKYGKGDDLLIFLSLLMKTETSILKEEHARTQQRFSTSQTQNYNSINQIQLQRSDKYKENESYCYIQPQQTNQISKNSVSVDDVVNDFLYNHCVYDDEQLANSKHNASKVKKVVEIFVELVKDTQKSNSIETLNTQLLKDTMKIITKVPVKTGAIKGAYSFYQSYKNCTNSSARSITTIKCDLASFKRFIDYLKKKKYLNQEQFEDVIDFYESTLKSLKADAKNNKVELPKNVEAFKDEMLINIFDKNKKPYQIIFHKLQNPNNKDKDINILKFYTPILMFFSGARVAELVHIKTQDVEIFEYENKERLAIYITANQQRGLKTTTSRRKIYIHDYLANELNLINFVKKAKVENREFLFNSKVKDEAKVSKEFNRNKEFLKDTLSKDDEFFNAKYSLYSFRHLYKTHMLTNGESELMINYLQGHSDDKQKGSSSNYISNSFELINVVNRFSKHEFLKEQLKDFEEMSKKIC